MFEAIRIKHFTQFNNCFWSDLNKKNIQFEILEH